MYRKQCPCGKVVWEDQKVCPNCGRDLTKIK